MKLERNGIIAIAFGVTFAILLLFNIFTSGFKLEIKGILVSIYFAVWVGAVTFVILTFIIPFLTVWKVERKKGKSGSGTSGGPISTPFKSPRSGLPVRERILAYVTERRREDGLPAPEPLHPSRTSGSSSGSPSVTAVPGPSMGTVSRAVTSSDNELSGNSDFGDLPLPDDFESSDDISDSGDLPGLDDDFGSIDGISGGDDIPSDFGDDNSGFLGQDGEDVSLDGDASNSASEPFSDDGLPGLMEILILILANLILWGMIP